MNSHKNQNFKKYLKEYCEVTSIHGFKYFGENRSIFEKLWWALTFLFCLSGCCIMIYTIYEKYEKSPVIVTFATKETSIYEIPFPAVTICPQIKSDKTKFNFEEVLKKGQNSTKEEKLHLEYISLLCNNLHLDRHFNNETFGQDILNIIDQVKPNFLDHIHNCSFMGKKLNCRNILIPVITDEGVCYSFNILDRKQIFSDLAINFKNYHVTNESSQTWTFETGYTNITKLDIYPRRALLPGASNGLILHLETFKKNLDYSCKTIQGFKVILHAPMRMPRLQSEFFRLDLDESVVAAVQPQMISTSSSVKSYKIEKRDCVFPSERNLKFFRFYSQLNCQLECLTNFTEKHCNCVALFMPRENYTKLCGSGKYECLKNAEKSLLRRELDEKFGVGGSQRETDCNCMPLCTDLSYFTQISQTKLNSKKISSEVHLSSLNVYFKFNHFITSERNELYGPTDFLANFGGLLGLFTGFSILSLMEIIYFLTLRICCNIKMYNKWTGVNKQ